MHKLSIRDERDPRKEVEKTNMGLTKNIYIYELFSFVFPIEFPLVMIVEDKPIKGKTRQSPETTLHPKSRNVSRK